ncbi:NAD(+) diphosphatase [Iodobacter sp. LRB]|uniref:NAD(+) diphosphatase n=1 Tax=unclassified Iodobacter TaxID=235634 RepID=UPI000C10173D|nr:NAD(+) diphosphatase [Iodobacter sp. BJB302]PHV01376.1 NAD(+) diphosphatase [Iodobacter sp. BJB302]
MLPTAFIPEYKHLPASANSLCLAFIGDQLLVFPDGRLPEHHNLPAHDGAEISVQIGSVAGQSCVLMAWHKDTPYATDLQAIGLRAAWGLIEDSHYWIAARAQQLLTFDRQHRFCGCCGTATTRMNKETARECPACLHRAYPRVSPAIMVLIKKDRQLLLARSPHFRPGVYSALAGFVEAGESCEEAVFREIYEEVGVKVSNLSWFGSQSHPFPHSLMLAFIADYVSGEITPQEGEIEDAQWFGLENLPELPGKSSIAYHLIQAGLAKIAHE